jgi:hypothetical protein
MNNVVVEKISCSLIQSLFLSNEGEIYSLSRSYSEDIDDIKC